MTSSKALDSAARRALKGGALVLSVSFFLSFVVNVLRLSGPLFMILIYDRVLTSRSVETLVALFSMMAVFLIVLGVVDYARKRIIARFAAQFQERVETTLLASTPQNEMFQRAGTKPAAGIDEVDGLRGFFHGGALIAVMDFVWVPMFVTVVFLLHPVLGAISLGGVAIMLALILTQMVFMGARKDEARSASNEVGRLRNMLVASRDVVRSQEMGGGYKARWLHHRDAARDKAIALKDWTAWFDAMSKSTVLLTRYSILACGAYFTLEGKLTVGAMVAATFLVTRVLSPVDRFMRTIPAIRDAKANWDRLKSVLSARARQLEDSYREELGNPRIRLELDGLSVRSQLDNTLVLRGVSLKVEPGQMIEICGEMNAGKTMLAETILGMWRKSGGQVLLDGRNVARLSDEELTHKLGYVPDAPSFIAGTLEENISRLDENVSAEKVAHAARRAKLHALISALPDGYLTQIDARGTGFSRAQRYQLGLARAIYNDPALLILDDPDPALFERIPKKMELTLGGLLKRGGSVVMLSRKPVNFSLTSRRLHLKQGRLSEVTSGSQTPKSANQSGKVTVLQDNKGGGSVSKIAR